MTERMVGGFIPLSTPDIRGIASRGIRESGFYPAIEAEVSKALGLLNRAADSGDVPYALITGLGRRQPDTNPNYWEAEPLVIRSRELNIPTGVMYPNSLGRSAISRLVIADRRNVALPYDSKALSPLAGDISEWLFHILS